MVTKKTEETDPWSETSAKDTIIPLANPHRDFLTVTLKAGSGYDAPWLVAHASSVEEALEFHKHPQLEELMDLTARKGKEFARAFGGPQSAAKAAASTGGGGSWGNKPAAQVSGDIPTDVCPVHQAELVHVKAFKKPDGTDISARVACQIQGCRKITYWQNKDGSWTKKEQ